MQLRTYRGKSMGDALTAVKRELGPDALIIHTRSFKVGGVLGVGAREEVEILASRRAAPPHHSPQSAPRAASHTSTPSFPGASTGRAVADRLNAYHAARPLSMQAAPAPARAPADAPLPPPAPAAPPPQPRIARPEPQVMQVRRRPSPPPVQAPSVPTPAPAASSASAVAPVARLALASPSAAGGASSNQFHDELGAIKSMVAQLLAAGAGPRIESPAAHAMPAALAADPLADWYLRLLSNAVSRELAERIVADVRRRVGRESSSSAALAAAFRECIASYIPAAKESLALPADGALRPRTIAIVGATGVGKTTTVAKLAAQTKLARDARIGVITCDANRIGAIEQLRTYADILTLPFRVAATPAEMHDARASLADTDLLLIDTPGLSPRDDHGIRALASLLESADVSEVHLALPASGAQESLLAACRAFAPLHPSRLLFTKLDEAVTYGVILSVAAEVKTELSFLTTGPRVPEQIEATDPVRLAEMIAA